MPKLTICGGGNAAHVLIALAANAGWEVDVFAPLADETERLQAGLAATGGITAYFGDKTITGRARRISADPGEVIPGSELVLLALPAFAHGPMLQAIAGSLEPKVTLGALPARGGFDFQARSMLDAKGLSPRIFGLQTLPWACRIITYGQAVDVLGTKAEVGLALFPPNETSALAERLTSILGLPIVPVASFLTLTLANTGQLIHPGIMYGLSHDKESATFSPDEIPLFYQGVDQPTADILQAMSDEVQTIAGELAARLPDFNPQGILSVHDWLLRSYPTDIADGSTLRRAFNTNKAYVGLRLPTRLVGPDTFAVDYTARYLAEDVPYGLVVLRGIAELAGVATPTIDEVITWAQAHLKQRYLVNGTLSGPDLSKTRAPQIYGILDFESLKQKSKIESGDK
jgi:hypothetical protein